MRPPPVATLVITLVTAVVATIGYLDPGVQDALRRDPAALAAGQWWRLATPLLVRTDSPIVLVVVLAGTLLAGSVVERAGGWPRLLALYLAGGLVGQAAGELWDPHGAGSSVAMLGLFAGLWVLMAVAPDRVEPRARVIGALGLTLVAALAGAAAAPDQVVAGAVVGGVTGAVSLNLTARVRTRVVARGIAVAAVAGGVVLTALRDDHGPAILAGALVAVPLFVLIRTRPDRTGGL